TKYLDAAKGVADRAVLLPDGFRFSPSKTRRDWTDEGTAALRAFYAPFAAGRFEDVAAKEKLNAKYLGVLWRVLSDKTPSHPLDSVRAKWRAATESDVPALAADVAAWQAALWKTVKV